MLFIWLRIQVLCLRDSLHFPELCLGQPHDFAHLTTMQTETSSKVAATRVMEGRRGSGSALEWFSVANSPRTVSCFSVRSTRCLKFSSSVASEFSYNLRLLGSDACRRPSLPSQMPERLRVQWFGISVLNKHLNSSVSAVPQ